MKRTLMCAMWLLVSGLYSLSFAQGVQTGIIRGTVRDQQNLPVPSVTVTISSPALQGSRKLVTGTQGDYTSRLLPAGDYEITFELSGFATVTQKTTLPLGLTVEQNVTLWAAGVTQTVQVVAEAPPPIATPVVGANFTHDEIEPLATPRTLQGITQLSPGLNENSPTTGTTGGSVGQVVIHGAFAFDNVFLINGVDVNDNLFATPQNLFVEDAIQETQVLTSGISSEYGRFGGGVVNAITKSGGNAFSGSGRINFLNPSWTTETPFEIARGVNHLDTVSRIYEGTFGGPLVKDHLWFFTSGRYASVDNQVTLPQTGIALTSTDSNKRGEIKLTGTLAQNHTIQGGYLNNPRMRTNNSGVQAFLIDPRSEVDRTNPNWYYYTNYKGVSRQTLFVEAQYSERRFGFQNDGGTSTNILDSPFLSATQCACIYNAPYGSARDPEQRNNRQLTGSMTSYWNLGGRHESKGGYEFFRSHRAGGGSQSPTSYVFNSDFATNPAGVPLLDSTGRLIPVFVAGLSSVDFYPAVVGAVMKTDTNSLYVQDHWVINSRWSADLGARYEHVKAVSTGNIVSINNNRIVPRLATAYDVQGNGSHIVHLTYGQYSGRYGEGLMGANSPVGNPSDINFTYRGPAGQGVDFAPGFNLANYPLATAAVVSAPTANVFMDPNLKSPLTHEFTTSYGANLGNGRGYADVAYVYRRTTDLVDDFQTVSGGFTHVVVSGVDAGLRTNKVYKNTDLARREYQAMVFESRFRISNRWSVNGHHTLQLKNEGNYEGEAAGQPGNLPSFIGNYPEAFSAARNFPDGRLQSFQRHRLRAWTIYDFAMGRYGDLSVSGLWRVDSARVYSLAARNQALTASQLAIIARTGYPDNPGFGPVTANQVFFGDRGSEEFAGYGLLDASITYDIPVFRTLRPWVKLDVYNLFDNKKLIAWNTTVSQDRAAGVDSLGLATSYTKNAAFGTATGNTVTNLYSNSINAFPLAFNGATAGGRTFLVAVGFRF